MPGGLVVAALVLSSGWRAAVLLGQAQGAPSEPGSQQAEFGSDHVHFDFSSAPWEL